MIWNPQRETLPRDQLAALQLGGLRQTVDRLLASVPPMADRLRRAGISSGCEIESLSDLQRLPFTHRADFQDYYPTGLFAVPLERVVRFHASSGTHGRAKIVGYTSGDLAMWAEVVARCLGLAGVRPGMRIHNAYGYGLFTGGLGLHAGAELFGAPIIPASGGFTQRQAMLLRDLGSAVLCCTPSYALTIAEALEIAGIDPATLPLAIGIFGAEPWTDELRRMIEQRLDIDAVNIYGLSEIVGPGVSAECLEARQGSHIQEDHFLAEIVDPTTGRSQPGGADGELVFTTLTKEALPVLRYRTGDISALDVRPCICGRTTARMRGIRGRTDDMLIIRGVNLYPSAVERVLLTTGDAAPHYQLLVERVGTLDQITLRCEVADPHIGRDALEAHLRTALREATGLSIAVDVQDRGNVPRSEGKALRVVDKRPR